VTATDAFEACRPRLLGVAYGMLGDRGEAEDVVQDAWLRFHDQEGVRNAEAFLVTVTTRLAMDRLRSARARRETYVGPWLPEPIVSEDPRTTSADPAQAVEEAEGLSLALLVALERLNPVERAVFLLRDVFDLDYDEIADVVERTPANCRQIANRAREHVGEPSRGRRVDPEEERRVLEAFFAASLTGDLEGLTQVLAADAILYSDGGGVVRAARKPIYGAAKCARFVLGIQRKIDYTPPFSFVRVNGEPAVRVHGPVGIASIMVFEIADGKVANLRLVNNPEKLRRAGVIDTDG
jgi:RNA polymerase sigma-70 factor (ECF subfamily)